MDKTNDLYRITEEEKNKLIDKQRKKCVLLRSKIVTNKENIIQGVDLWTKKEN